MLSMEANFENACAVWGWRVASSARPQTVALDHTRLDHAGVQGQEHDTGVQVVADLEGGCQAHFHRFRQAWIVALSEALRAQNAVSNLFELDRDSATRFSGSLVGSGLYAYQATVMRQVLKERKGAPRSGRPSTHPTRPSCHQRSL